MDAWFDKNDLIMYYKYLDKCNYYFEYGIGRSLYQASLRDNIKRIIGVESDPEWVDKVKGMIGEDDRVEIRFCEMDAIPKKIGRPGPKSTKEQWINYSDQIIFIDKDLVKKLDFVLIDGRFRVACCLKCFDVVGDNCYIAFDDFFKRCQLYRIVLNYYEIVDITDDKNLVILQKKKGSKSPSLDLIKQYEEEVM